MTIPPDALPETPRDESTDQTTMRDVFVSGALFALASFPVLVFADLFASGYFGLALISWFAFGALFLGGMLYDAYETTAPSPSSPATPETRTYEVPADRMADDSDDPESVDGSRGYSRKGGERE